MIPKLITVILVLAAAIPAATADPIEDCTGANDEPGLIINVYGTSTGCTHPCEGPDHTVGVSLELDGEPVLECHQVQICETGTGVILDEEPICFAPFLTNCPPDHFQTPTSIEGVPGWPSPTFLCVGLTLGGCSEGFGITVVIRHDGDTQTHPVCVEP